VELLEVAENHAGISRPHMVAVPKTLLRMNVDVKMNEKTKALLNISMLNC